MMTLDDMIEQAIAFARRTLVGKPDAELLPCWLIQGSKRTTIVGTPFDGDLSKDFTAVAIRLILKEENANSYSFISEAWMACQDVGAPIVPASKSDNRCEIVMVTAADRMDAKMRTWEIVRDTKGVVTELKANALPSDVDRFQGRFHNLFAEEDSL